MKQLTFLLLFVSGSSLLLAQPPPTRWTIDNVFAVNTSIRSLSDVKWKGNGFSFIETDRATKNKSIYFYNVTARSQELLVDSTVLMSQSRKPEIRIGAYEWSPDGENILISGSLEARRTKSGGPFGVFNLRTKRFHKLGGEGKDQAIIQFSPDGKRIGFVRGNNLFVLDLATKKETQLTFDGSENILNGIFDWVYEEEFSIINGWQWSPDGKRIAFWRLDQTNVPSFPLVRYSANDSHAELELMKYPKAGDRNALVQIGVVHVEDKSTRWLDLGTNPDIYVPRIQWTENPNVLSVQRLNRGQDTLDLMLADVTTGSMKTVLTETDSAWLEVERDDLTFLKDGKRFVWVSWKSGFTHIYLYTLDGKLERQLTQGNWDVSDVAAVDQKKKLVYFVAAKESPLERHLYSVSFDGTHLKKITSESGWHAANFSPDCATFIDTYSDASHPTQITLRKSDGTPIAPVVQNTLDGMSNLPVTQHSFFTFKTLDNVELNGYMLKPSDFDPSRKYPVLLFVYGAGPQTVKNQWGGRNYVWYQLLAERGYIVASVDPRGTDARGKQFRQSTNRELGYKNTQDIVSAGTYLGSLPFVDASRIGIWGWSGGGYHTLMAMTYGAEVFKTGIAVAAVSDFKFYDTIWTERYMDTPQQNPDGYKKTSVLTYADKLKGNLLIVHGTTDDNVHWQNVIVLMNEFIKKGKQFETMLYPGRAHGISDTAAQKHLFTMMTKFIVERL